MRKKTASSILMVLLVAVALNSQLARAASVAEIALYKAKGPLKNNITQSG